MLDSDVLFGFRLRLFDHAREVGVSRGLPHLRDPPLDLLPLEGAWSSAPASRCSGRGSAGRRGCPTRRARSSRRASSPSPSPTRGWDRGGSAPAWPRSAGAASSSATPASGASCAGTASPAGSAASRSWPATPRRPGPEPRRARARAPHRGRPSRRARRLRLLPRGSPQRHDGSGLAVHRHRPSPRAVSGPSCTRRRSTPRARNTSRLARRVAADLARHGWRLERVLTDNGSEFRSSDFGDTLRELGAVQTLHPPRAADDQRRGRAGAAHHPRGVLATLLRAEPRAQARRPRAGPRELSALLQRRSAPTPGATPRAGRPGRRSSERGR